MGNFEKKSIESGPDINIERKEKVPYKAIVVAPGFESYKHRSGLHWDTRIKLLAAAACYETGHTEKIIVGGRKIRQMQDSFANLMKKELLEKYKIPENAIETEESTFDTASQIDWVKHNIDKYEENLAFITNPAQVAHIKELLKGFDLEEVNVLSIEDIIKEMPNSRHLEFFFEKLHKSPYWLKYRAREKLLTLFTKYIDKKGEKIRRITKARLK